MNKDADDLIVERLCLEILQNSEVMKQIQIVNGLEAGNITKALAGKRLGQSSTKNNGWPRHGPSAVFRLRRILPMSVTY